MNNTMFNHDHSITAASGIHGLTSKGESTMKLYFVTQDVMPNADSHFIGADLQPDMVTPVWFKAQVIDAKTAKTIKALHGAGLTAVIDVEGFGWQKDVKVISFVDDMGCTHSHRYYIPAL